MAVALADLDQTSEHPRRCVLGHERLELDQTSNRRAWSPTATEARNPAGRREAIRTYVLHMGSDVPKGLCGAARVGP